MLKKLIKILFGEPLSNEQAAGEKYNIPFGLAVMASDSISSVAYAGQEILFVLIGVLGLASYYWLGWISLMIIGLLFILTISYIQIIKAYPQGGGAYIVAKENLGTKLGLVAAASLLIDYILTVSVSASSGVAAITSAFPNLQPHAVKLVIISIIILTILNLRGVSESSKIFSIPTYLFILGMILLITYGVIKYFLYGAPTAKVNSFATNATGTLSIFLILRAFSSGCSALTGLEAVSNAVPSFKEPSQKNAKIVMILLSGLILFIFGGTSLLARFYHPVLPSNATILSQITFSVFGNSFMYYFIQITTAIISLMACNTAFTGFPMLMSVIAKDGFAPRQFTIKGKRLSLSIGIVVLSFISGILVFIFNADVHNLIPLYSVGVFLSFTLAQTGMIIHWKNSNESGWRKCVVINSIGMIVTFITTIIIIHEKFLEGAWIVIILIPILVFTMSSVWNHYNKVAEQLKVLKSDLENTSLGKKFTHIVIVPIASLNKASLSALQYARSITDDVIALSVSANKDELEKLKIKWNELNTDILLISKYSTYRQVITPLLQYLDTIADAASDTEKITVLMPQFVTHTWWGNLLHNHTGFFIRENLLRKSNIIISTYPYHLNDDK
ncbi:APC family permease [Clostridium scatologenes]|uniref:Amino acid permease n=1 Tax=Clostridium scatologenes TaxID=1548 RepID=A0A0E3M7X9_CLOSL|nr:APC family permease [Clostridium scatologenes]AKA70900.1 amino acid permease [Clostridium scatologenes]